MLQCIQGGDENALARICGRTAGGKPAPRIMVLALLHLNAQLQHHNGHSTFGALAGDSRFMPAFEAEMHRARRLISGAHEELLTRLAEIGKQLPTDTSKGDDAFASTAAAAPLDAAAELEECVRLRSTADQIAVELIALDDCTRQSVEVMAQLAATYDAALLEAEAVEDPQQQQQQQASDRGARRRSGRQQQAQVAVQLPPAPLTAVCSHSAPGQHGKYTAGGWLAGGCRP